MNREQIKAVREALTYKFNAAVETLNKQVKIAASAAGEQAAKVAKTAGKTFARDYVDVGADLNTIVRAARKAGVEFQGRRRGWSEDIPEIPEAVDLGPTEEATQKAVELATASLTKKIEDLKSLKESTFLSLYDVDGSKLAELVADVAAKIAEISRAA